MTTPREIIRSVVLEIADQHGVSPEILTSYQHPRALLAARVELARRLTALGHLAPKIAEVMRRDYTTVYFYLGRTSRRPALKPPPPPPPPPAPTPEPTRGPARYAGWDPLEKHWG